MNKIYPKTKDQPANWTRPKEKQSEKCVRWDSADLNRGPSVPNARGWTKLPYYPKGYLLSNEIILYIAFVRTWVCCSFSAHRNFLYFFVCSVFPISGFFLRYFTSFPTPINLVFYPEKVKGSSHHNIYEVFKGFGS